MLQICIQANQAVGTPCLPFGITKGGKNIFSENNIFQETIFDLDKK